MGYSKKRVITSFSIIVLIVLLALLSVNSRSITGAFVADVEVSPDLSHAFAKSTDEISVIVVLKDVSGNMNEAEKKEAIKDLQEQVLGELNTVPTAKLMGLITEGKDFELEHRYENVNALAGNVTEAGLAKLRSDPHVETIVVNKERQLFLDGSVPLVNGDDAHNLVVAGYNITGEGQTVCVVDTGIDYTHPGLTGAYVAGYDYYNNDSDPLDDQGHGTHVAGIIASSDATYHGLAPGAKIAAVKVCSSAGSCPDADVLAGIDWCIANKNTYNISVISISLGGGQYTSYCDQEVDFTPYAVAVNDAVANNILVVAATGNSGAGSIAGPACLQNATRVTATTKADVYPSYASRYAFFTDTLTAPGSVITSLRKGGGTISMSGTSMATPHISAAAALIEQYWKLAYGISPTPEQVKLKIMNTGKKIYDSSTGSSYTRVDVLAALQPFLTYTLAPQDAAILNTSSITITVVSDVDLSTAFLQLVYPDGVVANLSMKQNVANDTATNILSTKNFSLTLNDLTKGAYSYTVYGTDAGGMTGATALQTFTIDNTAPTVSLQYPITAANLSTGLYTFSAAVEDVNSVVDTVFFNVSSGNTVQWYAAADNGSAWVKEINLSDLSEGLYDAIVFANDSFGNANHSGAVAFTIDRTAPDVTLLNSSFNTTDSATAIGFYAADALSAIAACNLLVDGNISNTATVAVGVNSSLSSSNLSLGSHLIQVQCTDAAGNQGVSGTITVTVNAVSVPASATLNLALMTPHSGDVYKSEQIIFNATVNSSAGVSSVVFNITNAFGNVVLAAAQNTSLSWTATVDMNSLVTGAHTVEVAVQDILGNVNKTSVSFTVDHTGPALSSITEVKVNDTSATIQWSTDESADSSVAYGVSNSLGTEIHNLTKATTHNLQITPLTAAKLYYYAITSCDSLANCNTSSVRSFTTTAATVQTNNSNSSSNSSSSSGSSGSSSGSSSSSSSSSGSSSSSSSSAKSSASEPAGVAVAPPVKAKIKEPASEPAQEKQQEVKTEKEQAPQALNVQAQPQNTFGSAVTGFVTAAMQGALSSKEYVLVGLTSLVVILTIAFIAIRKREHGF